MQLELVAIFVDDYDVEFEAEPRDEAYGRVAAFTDIAGNRWDLLGPREGGSGAAE